MKSNRTLSLTALLAVTTLLLIGVAIGSIGSPSRSAFGAPLAAPTPVTSTQASSQGIMVDPVNRLRILSNATVIQAATAADVSDFEKADVQWTVDVTSTSAVTLTAMWSNDKVNWIAGPSLVANRNTDGSDMVQILTFGRWMAVRTQSNSNTIPVTVTVLALGK